MESSTAQQSSTGSNNIKSNNQSDTHLTLLSDNEKYPDIAKLEKRKTIFETITLASVVIVLACFVTSIIISNSGQRMGILSRICTDMIELGIIVFIVFLILTINSHSNIKKAPKLDLSSGVISQKPQKNSSGAAIASLICAIIPLAVLLFCLAISGASGNENGAGAVWWIFAIYCWTLGLPLLIVWLVCGIIGLKSAKRNLSIVSLVTLPIGILVLILITILANAH